MIEREIFPGPEKQSDAELAAHARRFVKTVYHPCGTCRMGADEGAVVTNDLRLRGVEGLRVVDASVMPTIISGNTNAAVLVVAETRHRRSGRVQQAAADPRTPFT